MSVNLSASDISDLDLLESISRAVTGAGIEPTDLVVEVTESVLLNDTEQTMDFLTRLKDLGVGWRSTTSAPHSPRSPTSAGSPSTI